MSALNSDNQIDTEVLNQFEQGQGNFLAFCKDQLTPHIKYLDKPTIFVFKPGCFGTRTQRAIQLTTCQTSDSTFAVYLTRDEDWYFGRIFQDTSDCKEKIDIREDGMGNILLKLGYYHAVTNLNFPRDTWKNHTIEENRDYLERVGRTLINSGICSLLENKREQLQKSLVIVNQLSIVFSKVQPHLDKAV